MVGCILTGHGEFALGLASAVEMIAGPQDSFTPITFTDQEAASFPVRLREQIESYVEEQGSCLVFCDILGGSPFNQAMMIASEIPEVEVIGGTNLGMLLEILCSRGEKDTALSLAQAAVEAGKTSVEHKSIDMLGFDEEEEGEGI